MGKDALLPPRFIEYTAEEARLARSCTGAAGDYYTQMACVDQARGIVRGVLSRDRYWRLIGVYEPDEDGLEKWVTSVGQGGAITVTYYGSRTGKKIVEPGDWSSVLGLVRDVAESFYSTVRLHERQGRRLGAMIDVAAAFSVSVYNRVRVGNIDVLTRIVVDVDSVDITQSNGSFEEELRLIQLAAADLYEHLYSTLGLEPLKHVTIYFSGARGLHVEVLLPVTSPWMPMCPSDARPGIVLAKYIRGALPKSVVDETQILNMVSRAPFSSNLKTGLPKVPLGEDGKPIDRLPTPSPVTDAQLVKLYSEASEIPVADVCNSYVSVTRPTSNRRATGTVNAWRRVIDAVERGEIPKFTDCRERLARVLGRWCREAGIDQDSCIELFDRVAENGKRYATYVRQGWREGEHLHPPHPEKVFCGNEWYSCRELDLCGRVRA